MSGRQFAAVFCFVLACAVGGNLAVVFVATSQPVPPKERLLVVLGEPTVQQQLMLRGAAAAAERHGVELIGRRLGPDAASAGAILHQLDVGKFDGVVLCDAPASPAPTGWDELAARPRVITCSVDQSPSRWHRVGPGDYSSGRICANLVASEVPAGSPLVVLVDDASAPAVAERLAGFREGLRVAALTAADESPAVEVVECLEDFGHAAMSVRNARLALARHPRVTCIVDLGDRRHASNVARLASFTRRARLELVTFDASESALAAVERGDALAVLVDNPFQQGYQAVNRLARYCRGSELALPVPGRGSVNVPACVIRRRDAAQARAERGPLDAPAT